MSEKKFEQNKDLVQKLLAQHLGIEPDDINDDDNLYTDLHMTVADLSDFLTILEDGGIDTSNIDLTEIETFSDLIENLFLDTYS